jgi:hypothetical protein
LGSIWLLLPRVEVKNNSNRKLILPGIEISNLTFQEQPKFEAIFKDARDAKVATSYLSEMYRITSSRSPVTRRFF